MLFIITTAFCTGNCFFLRSFFIYLYPICEKGLALSFETDNFNKKQIIL